MEDKVDQIKFSLLDVNGKDFDCELMYLVRREATAEDVYSCSALLYGLHSIIKNYPDFVYDLGQVAFRAAHSPSFLRMMETMLTLNSFSNLLKN